MKPLNAYLNDSHINASCIIEHINESSEDNLVAFARYIEENGEEGKLSTCHKSWYDYYDECDLFKNQKFSQNVDNTVYGQDYCEEHGLDSVFDDEEGFSEHIKNMFDEGDLFVFEFERGLIKCERVIDVTGDDYDKHEGHIGKYWSFIRGAGDSHGSVSNSRNDVVVYALVDPKDVDWAETIAANMIDPEEYEITLVEGAPIQITKISEKRTNKTLLEKDILYTV